MTPTREQHSTTVGQYVPAAVPVSIRHSIVARRACGHCRHVGTCPSCQQAALRRQLEHLDAAIVARQAWAQRATISAAGIAQLRGDR
jgi:hypothetical protein